MPVFAGMTMSELISGFVTDVLPFDQGMTPGERILGLPFPIDNLWGSKVWFWAWLWRGYVDYLNSAQLIGLTTLPDIPVRQEQGGYTGFPPTASNILFLRIAISETSTRQGVNVYKSQPAEEEPNVHVLLKIAKNTGKACECVMVIVNGFQPSLSGHSFCLIGIWEWLAEFHT